MGGRLEGTVRAAGGRRQSFTDIARFVAAGRAEEAFVLYAEEEVNVFFIYYTFTHHNTRSS